MTVFVGVGNPFADRFAKVTDAFLKENHLIKNTTNPSETKEPVERTWINAGSQDETISLGGSAANVIKVLAWLKNQTALIGKIGSDEVGANLSMLLQLTGINTFLAESSKETGVVNCFLTPDHIRTMHFYSGASADLSEEDILKAKEAFFEGTHVHIEGYLAYCKDSLVSSVRLAKKAKATVSLDLSSDVITGDKNLREKLILCLAEVDFVFGNLQEVLKLTGAENAEGALASPLFNERQLIVITNGGDGCFVKGQRINLSPVDDIVDTTGAGDYFIAGFLNSYYKQKSLEDCVQNGHLMASQIIKELGTNLSSEALKHIIRGLL